MRLQFDPNDIPKECRYFDLAGHSKYRELPAEEPKVIAVSSNGYVEHTFENRQQGRQFGLRWLWDD